MSPPSSRHKGAANVQEDSVRARCIVVSSGDKVAILVMQVENPRGDNPLVVPVTFYPKRKDLSVGMIVRVNVYRELNSRSRKVELKGRSLGVNVNDVIEPIPYETAVRFGFVGKDEKAVRTSRQPRGPPAALDGKERDSGFKKKWEGNPASGDATSPLLSPNCDLPARGECSDSQQILPKQLKFSMEEESPSPVNYSREIESQLFGVNAEVVEPNKIAFVEDGCTFYCDLEENVEFTDLDGVMTNLEREDVQGRIQVGQLVLVDVKVGQGHARVFALKIPEQPVEQQGDFVDLEPEEVDQGQDYVLDKEQMQLEQFQDVEDQDCEVAPATGDQNDEATFDTENHLEDSCGEEAQEKGQDGDQSEVMVSCSGEIPVPVQSVEGEFEPVAAEEELVEVDKMEERLASIYSCDAYVGTEDATSSPKVEEPVEVETEMGHDCSEVQIEELPDDNLGKGPTLRVEEQATAKQIAESAALDAVGAFMRKFLKYDEMAVEVMLEGFQKKLLGSITEKYDVQDTN